MPDADPLKERAAKAVKVFRQLQPTLNSFARTFTGNPRIRVEAHARETGTDGNVIYFRVPLTLADMGTHLRSECGKRDAYGHQVCFACDQRELVMVTIYHEISHVVSGSVEPITESRKVSLTEESMALLPEFVRKQARRAIMSSPYGERMSYMHVASHISKWLPFLTNSLEDSRVDAAMYAARPGTLAMKQSQLTYYREDGVEQLGDDGRTVVVYWYDYPVNSQVSLACYFIASGLDTSGWFCDEVNEVMTDEQLLRIIEPVPGSSAEDIYLTSVRALVRLWELGYLDPPTPPEESDEDDDSEEDESDSDDAGTEDSGDGGSDDGENKGSQGLPDPGSDGEGGGPGGGPSGEGGSESSDVPPEREGSNPSNSDDSAGKEREAGTLEQAVRDFDNVSGHRTSYSPEATPEGEEGAPVGVASASEGDTVSAERDVAHAILVGEYFETESRGVGEVYEYRYDTFPQRAWGWSYEGPWPRGTDNIEDFMPGEMVLGPALLRMRAAFADNQRYHYQRNLKSGRIAGRVLGKRAIHDDQRLFQVKRIPGKRSYFVMIALDISGSIVGLNLDLEKRAVTAQAELLHRSGIPFTIVAHSANYVEDSAARTYSLDLYHVKDEGEPWDTKTKTRLAKLGPHAGNLDGHVLEYMRRAADASSATDKVLLYYSDGKFPATNADEEREVLERELATVKRRGYTLLGVGIRTDSPREVGMDTVEVWDDAGIVQVVRGLEERLIRR